MGAVCGKASKGGVRRQSTKLLEDVVFTKFGKGLETKVAAEAKYGKALKMAKVSSVESERSSEPSRKEGEVKQEITETAPETMPEEASVYACSTTRSQRRNELMNELQSMGLCGQSMYTASVAGTVRTGWTNASATPAQEKDRLMDCLGSASIGTGRSTYAGYIGYHGDNNTVISTSIPEEQEMDMEAAWDSAEEKKTGRFTVISEDTHAPEMVFENEWSEDGSKRCVVEEIVDDRKVECKKVSLSAVPMRSNNIDVQMMNKMDMIFNKISMEVKATNQSKPAIRRC